MAVSAFISAAAVALLEAVETLRETFKRQRQAQAAALKPESDAAAGRIDDLVAAADKRSAAPSQSAGSQSPGLAPAPALPVGDAPPASAGGAGASSTSTVEREPPGSR